MCGIAGIWRRDGGPLDGRRLRRIAGRVAHRGPDATATWSDGSVGLTSYRFSLEDLPGGTQPAHGDDVTVVFNGEVFNWRELARKYDLPDVTGDTQLLPRLIAKAGPEVVGELNGQFALAAYDRATRRLLLARDAAGILPLVYRATPSEIVFASELRAVTADPNASLDFDQEALGYFLRMGFFVAPQTPFAGVRQLEPGTALVFEPDGRREFRFGQPEIRAAYDGTMDQAATELVDLLGAAVRRRVSESSTTGLFLSGGIDSAVLAALLRRSKIDLPHFTVGFAGQGQARPHHFTKSYERGQELFNEFDLARATNAALGLPEPRLIEASAATLATDFAEIVHWLDIPCMSISAPPLFYLTGEAARDIRIALSGGGADELFAGYAHCDVRHYAGATSAPDRYLELVQVFSPEELRAIGSDLAEPAESVRDAVVRQTQAATCDDGALPFVLAAERLGPLPQNILQKNDRIGMRMPLEMRYPYLDDQVVRFGQRLPASLLADGQGGKRVLKEAARLLGIPAEIADRPKIRLQAPYATFLDDPAYADYFLQIVARPPSQARALYDPEKAVAFLFGPNSGSVWRRPAKIMLLATWNQWAADPT